jgi:ribosomal protein S18 acetylase RimI-like enzyme
VGIATCFVGFSTFQGKPLINVHDLAVCREHQGKGIGRKLLAAVREYATLHGMGAITLEVLQGNTRARELYNSLGFRELADPLPSEFFLFGKAKLA